MRTGEVNEMENVIEKRVADFRKGICPDCGARLVDVPIENYPQRTSPKTHGRYMCCSSKLTKEEINAGKRPCVFADFISPAIVAAQREAEQKAAAEGAKEKE